MVLTYDTPLRFYELIEASGTTIHDYGAQAHNGTAAGSGVTLGATGLIAGEAVTACTFNGSTGDVAVPTTGLPTGAMPFSMEAWINPAGLVSTNTDVLSFGTLSGVEAAELTVTSMAVKFVAFSGVGASATYTLVTGNIYHLVGTYDGTTMRLYINGALAASGAASLNIVANIAYIASDGSEYFNGTVAMAAWYGYALSPQQIYNHYIKGAGLVGTPTAGINGDVYVAALPSLAQTNDTMLNPSGDLTTFVANASVFWDKTQMLTVQTSPDNSTWTTQSNYTVKWPIGTVVFATAVASGTYVRASYYYFNMSQVDGANKWTLTLKGNIVNTTPFQANGAWEIQTPTTQSGAGQIDAWRTDSLLESEFGSLSLLQLWINEASGYHWQLYARITGVDPAVDAARVNTQTIRFTLEGVPYLLTH